MRDPLDAHRAAEGGRMTGLEVWRLIAPILAKCLPLNNSDDARDAYVTTYIALSKYKPLKEEEHGN